MDFDLAKTVFESIYSGTNGFMISQAARKRLSYTDKSHTYGEVTPEGFKKILDDIPDAKTGNFYDLGSGTGKGVILAAMFGSFSKLIGLEIIPELYQSSLHIRTKFEQNVRALLSESQKSSNVSFIQANFLDYDFSDANVIFTHSTCFYDELMMALEKKLHQVKTGTKIVTVT